MSFLIGQACMAQAPYTVGQYLRDKRTGERVTALYNAGDLRSALELHRTITACSPWGHFWRARLIWETGGSPNEELVQAFEQGIQFTPNTPPDSFELVHSALLRELEAQAVTKRNVHRIARCERLIERDQELASGPRHDSLSNRANVDTLDQLIREGGWPSSYSLGDGGIGAGVAIVLAHQQWDEAHHFQPYQALIERECLAGRESWMVALFTLQQRIRYTARNKTDTIAFKDIALPDNDPALPMVAAISERLTANGHKQVWIHAADSTSAQAIAERIVLVQPAIDTPPEVLEMLKAHNMDHPAPLTLERINLVVDPMLPRDRFLYRMN
ncbi:MAG: hypothetical protein H6591_05790 [Flavobacteriales bacterium]|nr:hypothetical protein [Flavobacteriales bacterium]